MEKKEFKVGEEFVAGLLKLKCIEGDGCNKCLFEDCTSCQFVDKLFGSCCSTERKDCKNVIFIKVE